MPIQKEWVLQFTYIFFEQTFTGIDLTNPSGYFSNIIGWHTLFPGEDIIISYQQLPDYDLSKITMKAFAQQCAAHDAKQPTRNTLAQLIALNPGTNANTRLTTLSFISYWIWTDVDTDGGCCCAVSETVFSKLRLNQRNDGRGVNASPKLSAGVGGSTAHGDPMTTRVGNTNRLDGAYVDIPGGGGGPIL